VFLEASYMLLSRPRSVVGRVDGGGLAVSLGYRLRVW
jgi:hypothetical protein